MKRTVGVALGILADHMLGEPPLAPHPVAAFGGAIAAGQTTLVPPGEALLSSLDLHPTRDGDDAGGQSEPESPPERQPGLQQFIRGLAEALERLKRHRWDGNFRELANFVDRLPRRAGTIDDADCRDALQQGALAPLPRAAVAARWLILVLRPGFFVFFFALDLALSAILVSVGV